MSLTIHGYKVDKTTIKNAHDLKGRLTVRPYVPAVFVKPQFVPRYRVFVESETDLYVPKHYGIAEFGPITESTRNVPQTDDKFWTFKGSIRPIQIPVVNSFLLPEPHDGIISLQTGGGKTVCGLYIAAQLKLPTIVLVHNTFLRDQWEERIRAFLPNARIGRVQGDCIEIDDKDVIVAMLQSVALKDHNASTFAKIGLVIVDECHHIASEAFSQAIPKLCSKYMLGLSATPERKDRLMHVINWFLGPMLYKSDNTEKSDTDVRVEYFEFAPEDRAFNEIIYNDAGVMFTTLMINKLVEYAPRNEFLVEILKDIYPEQGRQILVLSDRVAHTEQILEILPEPLKSDACVLSRKTKPEQRTEWCNSKKIIIATYAMCKEGFDVATLNTLLIATPRPDVDQIVGRILRQEKSVRTIHPLILDVVDSTFRRQFQERLQLYKKRSYDIQKMKI
jgi:superfamily II DNA or RNA helicase